MADAFPPWGTVTDAAAYVGVATKTVYKEVAAGRLRAARIGGRRSLRFRQSWLDEWLESTATPVEVSRV